MTKTTRRTARAVRGVVLFALALGVAARAQELAVADYRIGPKDLLEVSVFGVAEMKNLLVRVAEDGTITLPLLGEVNINGLTKTELERKLVGLLAAGKFLQNPQVTVFIKEYLSKRVSVMGAVAKTGSFELLGRQTLLQLISQAGGLTGEAGTEIIVIRPQKDGSSASLRIPVEDLIYKGDPQYNLALEAGDTVMVPVDKVVTIYVLGQVRNPGALEFKKSNLPTLLQAIAKAGGFTDRAARGGVIIRRRDASGRESELKVNVRDILKNKRKDEPLQENDTVYVPETLF